MEKSSHIVVTGGSGMVGTLLLERLRADGFASVSSPSSKRLDLRDQQATNQFFAAQPADYVFHLAGRIGGIVANMTYPVEFLYENMMIGLNVIHAARMSNVKKLLFLSSSCVYPRELPQPMTEDDLLTGAFEPTNEGYAVAKVAAMKLCEYSNRQYGTNFINLMACNLYGYGDHEPTNSHVVSALIYKFHRAKQLGLPHVEVWGTGTPRRELLFVGDMVDAMMHFMHHVDTKDMGAFVNIGSGRDITIRDLAMTIKDIIGYTGAVVFDPSKPDGMPRKLMDVSRASRLGWSATVDIPEGLRRTCDWYIANLPAETGVR